MYSTHKFNCFSEFDENLFDTIKIFCKKNHDLHFKEAIDRVEKQVNLRNLGNVYSQGLYMPKYKSNKINFTLLNINKLFMRIFCI